MIIENSLKAIARLVSLQVLKQSTMAAAAHKAQIPIESGIHRLPEIPDSPFSLFKKWHSENMSENHIASNALCLSTATKDGKVSSRSLILRRLDEDGFVIMTDNRSKKSKELDENPNAAMTFLWVRDVSGVIQSRQVRAEGTIKQLPFNEWKDIYESEPLFCKIRAYVCHQGQPVEWNSLKENHDRLLQEFTTGVNSLPKPDHVVAYKMYPDMMEFYETEGSQIADRVMYLKEEGQWENNRIAA